MEESMTLKPSRGARYFFPALLTFDKKFIEIMDLYPLKACAFIEGDHEPMPFYNGNWFSLVADNDEDQATFAERFYSVEARTSRDKRRVSIKDRLKEIVGSLEGELSNIASVTKFSVYSI
jgi:hypothetical protein